MRSVLGSRPWLTLALIALVLAAMPFVIDDNYLLHILILFLIFAVFATGWNLTLGILGQKTLGHHAFFAIGAYTTALLSGTVGLSPWLTLWLGVLAAALAGGLIGIPILRIRSMPHVAIVTLAFAEIVKLLLANWKDVTRGELGLWGIPPFPAIEIGGTTIRFGAGQIAGSFALALLAFVAVHALVLWLLRGRFGLTMVAIRDSQLAAESLSIDLTRSKLAAFALSAAIVGLSGGLYAHYLQILTPTSTAGPEMLVTLLAMIILGGVGTFFGPIFGALVLTALTEYLREYGDLRMLIYGATVTLFVILLPRGVAGLLTRRGRPAAAGDEPATAPET
ncbi:branched-chain amino acid ABC transporter permease [Paracoccus sp. S-4012]|uniref:branched-chain amino acid ABC transporter permease n=1 Tax=Paracoccus sp. S-4012 TaxID=2665648 RepID=UPI0012AEF6A9|nr:branched-chain amino acid ABC transporter permease [Paracoccus sp. S-4012]MRX49186.1 branched-chain amino acid ABC transporter permease [Paracoccus sp. S-4012]